ETLHNLIEISAALQPGQSGGPLYDATGKVVGMDSAATVSRGFRGRSGSSGGYAIPINDAVAIAHQIESGNASSTITIGTPPILGVSVSASAGSGVVVTDVMDASPAASIGLKSGDVITSAGSAKVGSAADLTAALHAHKAGDKVTITWTSDGVTHSAT